VSPYAVIATGFGLVVVAMLGVQLAAAAGQRRFHRLGEASHAALTTRFGSWAVLLLWLWTGFHFLAR